MKFLEGIPPVKRLASFNAHNCAGSSNQAINVIGGGIPTNLVNSYEFQHTRVLQNKTTSTLKKDIYSRMRQFNSKMVKIQVVFRILTLYCPVGGYHLLNRSFYPENRGSMFLGNKRPPHYAISKSQNQIWTLWSITGTWIDY